MSTKRQPAAPGTGIPEEIRVNPPDDYPRRVVAHAADLNRGAATEWHHHERGQLIYTRAGAANVRTEDGIFVLPPDRALWIPPRVSHRVRYLVQSELRTIYVRTEQAPPLPEATTTVNVTPLLRELIVTFVTFRRNYEEDGPEGRLVSVLIDQIVAAPTEGLRLPIPDDPRLSELAQWIRENPQALRSTEAIARDMAMSLRTFERRFTRATGMTFRSWRNKAKMLKALELLSIGHSVGETADQLGYEGQSAFIAGFKSTFGTTPGRYFGSRPAGAP